MSDSPITLHRLRRLPALVLPWVLVALLFTGIAHAGHWHKPDAAGHAEALHCGLCLQFDRLADAPSAPVIVTSAPFATWDPQLAVAALLSLDTPSLYDARGPPRI